MILKSYRSVSHRGIRTVQRAILPQHLIVALILGIVPISACSAQDKVAETKRLGKPRVAIGGDLVTCKVGCPTFVRVPKPPNGMRLIKFVAKFELTWNNYLAAYDAGACKLPQPNVGPGSATKNTLSENIGNLRIDWPIGQLGPSDVQCYISWLQKSTGYVVALPSELEWEWFARAGRVDAKYPWGNDADPSREALYGNERARLLLSPLDYRRGGEYVSGVKGGQFAPNNWGLYDLMGSERELTSNTVSGEEIYRRNPGSKISLMFRNNDNVVLKGSDMSDRDWQTSGISGRKLAIILEGHYSTSVAVRLVLIEGSN